MCYLCYFFRFRYLALLSMTVKIKSEKTGSEKYVTFYC